MLFYAAQAIKYIVLFDFLEYYINILRKNNNNGYDKDFICLRLLACKACP